MNNNYTSQEDLMAYEKRRILARLADEGLENQKTRLNELELTQKPVLDYQALHTLKKENRLHIVLEAIAGIIIDARLGEAQSLKDEFRYSGLPRDEYSRYYDKQVLPFRVWVDMQSFLISALTGSLTMALHRTVGVTHGPQPVIAQALLRNNLEIPHALTSLKYENLKEAVGRSFKRGEALQVFAQDNGKIEYRRIESDNSLNFKAIAKYANGALQLG